MPIGDGILEARPHLEVQQRNQNRLKNFGHGTGAKVHEVDSLSTAMVVAVLTGALIAPG